ncbi:hypothetical protein BS78_09G243200 [Paspalum vaginatum]|nr:hypothetical protein BS78_09G243200 [Paspalum vaginatum]
MSSREDENANKPVTVKIIETVYVEADTAADFKSVVQRLTGKDAVVQPEQTSWTGQGGSKEGASRGDRKAAGGASGTRQNG